MRIHVVREITYYMAATIHCYINKNSVGRYIYDSCERHIYIYKKAIRIYNINNFVGIFIGCDMPTGRGRICSDKVGCSELLNPLYPHSNTNPTILFL